ncbi:MAG: hypothetical protein L0H96_12035 [Humibacillus sp.]|nr:hypothetical protein [Humibacillus sp.]MDN5777634.1 hypothetical protein [Humibacillus sp.]
MPHRPGRRAAGIVLAVLFAGLLTSACTTGTAGDGELTYSPSAGVTGTPPPGMGAGSGVDARPPEAAAPVRPGAATQPALAPGMTPLPEASLCSVTHALTSAAPLQPEMIWPDAVHRGRSGTETVRRADPSCVSHQPLETTCDASFPFIAASDDTILLSLGADRLTMGEAHAEVTPPSGAIPSQAAVLYTVLHFPPSAEAASDLESTRSRLAAAVTTCTGGRPGHLGVDGLVGQRESVLAVRAFQDADFVFAASGRNLIWLVVDGAGWTKATRERGARSALAAITNEPAS